MTTTTTHRIVGEELHRIIGENDNLVIEVYVKGDSFAVAVRAPSFGDTLEATMAEPNHFNRGIVGKVVERP